MAARDHGDTPESSNSSSTAHSDDEANSSNAAGDNAAQPATETPGSDPLVHHEDNDSAVGFAGMVTGLNLLGDNIGALAVSSLIRDLQRSFLPDTGEWRRSTFGNIGSVLPAVESMQVVLGSAAFDAVLSVDSSGVESLIETVQAQQALTIKQMLPTSSVLESILPALQELSGFGEMQHSIIASSAIQQIVARPVVDMSALLDVVPSKTMLTDILTAADLAKNLDLSSVLPDAFGFPSFGAVVQAATAAQQAAAQVDEDEAEEAAVQAVLKAIGEELDPEAPTTPEQVAALETVARLLVNLRPHLSEHFTARGWLVGIATNGTLVAFVYLALTHPALLATLFTVASVATGTKWVYDKVSGLLLPAGMDGDENR